MTNPHDIITRPILSEKSMDGAADRRYTFVVPKNANKTQIRQAVEAVFGVQVDTVNTSITMGKIKKQGKNSGRRPTIKKAVVKLKASSKGIEFFDSMV